MNDCKRHKNRKKLIKNDEKRVHIKFMSFENIMHVPGVFLFLSLLLLVRLGIESFFYVVAAIDRNKFIVFHIVGRIVVSERNTPAMS